MVHRTDYRPPTAYNIFLVIGIVFKSFAASSYEKVSYDDAFFRRKNLGSNYLNAQGVVRILLITFKLL